MDYDREDVQMFALLRMKMQEKTAAQFAAMSRLNTP